MPGPHPKFRRPPVSEVACAWFFEPIPLFTAAIGALWSRFQEDFPLTQDVPLAPPPSDLDELGRVPVPMLAPGAVPRVWFLADDQRRLVQVQHDRFCFNWRRLEANDPYPEFLSVYRDFGRHRATFAAFAAEASWDLRPTVGELLYMNSIGPGDLIDGPRNVGRVLPDLAWRDRPDRVFAQPRAMRWQINADLPKGDGRIAATFNAPSGAERIALDLVARGPLSEGWYDRAHDAIVRAFEELTSPEAHAAWGRKEVSS